MMQHYCDRHGWRWEPGQGPSPCIGETASFLLSLAFFCYSSTAVCNSNSNRFALTHTQILASGGAASRVHGAQVFLSIAQAVVALILGWLSAGPRGMMCGALLLHSIGWPVAWLASGAALHRTPRSSKTLVWFWCSALVLNSIVLSSLRGEPEAPGRGLPAEIGCLSWVSFFGNALLVVLQLLKRDDNNDVYVRVIGQDGIVPSTVTGDDGGWQAFWSGGGNAHEGAPIPAAVAAATQYGGTTRRASRPWCFPWRGRKISVEDEGTWPIAGSDGGSLDESLLGSIGLGDHAGPSGASLSKTKQPARGWFSGRAGIFFSPSSASSRRQGNKGTAAAGAGAAAAAAAEPEEGRIGIGGQRGWLHRHSSPFGRSLGSTKRSGSATSGSTNTPTGAQQALSGGPSQPYSGAASIGVRAPPQVAAPVFGVAVTRWRLVDMDGTPSAHGSSGDVVWADRSTERSRASSTASSRTATLSGSEVVSTVVEGGGRFSSDICDTSTVTRTAPVARNPFEEGEASAGPASNSSSGEPLRVEFELLVRASGRGEMDWWGRSDFEADRSSSAAAAVAAAATATPDRKSDLAIGGSASATPGAGDWRVWRSAADTLALYDALALHFGQEFGRRVSRPKLMTFEKQGGKEDGSGTLPTPLFLSALHRVDIQRDTKAIGGFLRSLLGLRQFLSTAVMDYLAQPPPATALSLDGNLHRDDAGSDSCSNDGYLTPQDLEDERGSPEGANGRVRDSSSSVGLAGGRRRFSGGNTVDGGPSAGQAVAVAALATDYGAWLKRMAVRLRRAVPAGERFVRLRSIGPAVTGEQVIWWMVTSSGECEGGRATAVRLGQDLVSHRLLIPVCAGYERPTGDPAIGSNCNANGYVYGGGNDENEGDHFRSFDDAVGWLFAFAGDALRNPFAPPPPTQVVVMANPRVDVAVTGWTEAHDDDGTHVSFVVHIQVEPTQEAWDSPRRYREFTQLRKRLLRLGIDIPTGTTGATATARSSPAGAERGGGGGSGISSSLPKKPWRAKNFDTEHLETRRSSLEAFLQAAVKGALAAPHLSGHLVMRFLDPDESLLRVLPGQPQSKNPFANDSHLYSQSTPPGVGGGGIHGAHDSNGGAGGRAAERGGHHQGDGLVGDSLTQDRAEAEDFNTLTDSFGGFG